MRIPIKAPSCSKCFDDGSLWATRKSDRTLWTFVCDCPAGENSHWGEQKAELKIKKWKYQSEEIKDQYYVG